MNCSKKKHISVSSILCSKRLNCMPCLSMDSSVGCLRFFNSCGESMQEKLDSPMPWIGMYVAAASALISIAMAADVFHGFKNKKWWLPSKYFSMNAFSLTILAVSMKLPVDLTNQMLRVNEILARVSSLALMSTVMANLMTSLGTMESNDIILNLATIGTLVITIVVNVSIHISRMLDNVGKEFRDTVTSHIYAEQIICTVFMIILLVMLCYCGIIVPSVRRLVDREQNHLNEKASIKQVRWGHFTLDGLRAVLRDNWVNAKIVNPQFLIARSEISAVSGAMCVLTALTLLKAWLRLHLAYDAGVKVDASSYKWSINWILIIQTVGVGLGTVGPMLRWFLAAKLKSSKIREYWSTELLEPSFDVTETLGEWVLAARPSKTQNFTLRALVSATKNMVFLFFSIVLLVIFLVNALLLFVSAVFVKIILLPFPHDESMKEIESAWIALHKGEGVTTDSVKSIYSEVDKLIEIAEKKQPENLIALLKKSGDFNGVREFVDQPISRPEDVLNCWSLSIVILTTIAIQLPNIPRAKIDELWRGVTEGLCFVNLIEKSLNVNLEIYRYRLEADDIWTEVRATGYWTIIDLIEKKTYEETRKALEDLARTVSCEISGTENSSLYSEGMATRLTGYISSAIVGYIRENPEKTEADLFERISVMVSDLLFACLTNLVPLITLMCANSTIKEREENVREAAIIFGQSREILEMLQGRRLPELDPDKAAHLHEWRSFMEDNPNWMASV